MSRAYIISRSDYRAMVAEALSHSGTETGGTGLGVHREQEIIKVINVPAGPQAD